MARSEAESGAKNRKKNQSAEYIDDGSSAHKNRVDIILHHRRSCKMQLGDLDYFMDLAQFKFQIYCKL